MKAVIKAIYDISGEKKQKKTPSKIVKEMIKILDTNEDGVISIQEFLQGCDNDSYLTDLLAPAMYQIHL